MTSYIIMGVTVAAFELHGLHLRKNLQNFGGSNTPLQFLQRRTWQHRSKKNNRFVTSSSSSTSLLHTHNEGHNNPNTNEIHDSKSTYNEKYQQLMDSSTLSLAPMMEYTDRHFRYLIRLLSKHTLVYTEMVAANAIAHERNDAQQKQKQEEEEEEGLSSSPLRSEIVQNQIKEDMEEFGYDMTYLRRFLGQASSSSASASVSSDPSSYSNLLEGPSILQLGGSDPQQLQQATQTLMELTKRNYCDYTAINLNCGCPSPKVAGKGCFGAALMEEPRLVSQLVQGMHDGCDGALPITVKCRIGTDAGYSFTRSGYDEISEEEEYSKLRHFIETVASTNVVTDFQIHARIAVLSKKFSPADNRKIPKLKYQMVKRLVEDYPELTFSLNGGVETLGEVKEQLDYCSSGNGNSNLKGVMIGRALAANPWSFAMADEVLYGKSSDDNENNNKPKNRLEVLKEYGRYADEQELMWDPVKIRRFITKAVTTIFAGEPKSKRYRIALDEIAGRPKKYKAQGKIGLLEGEPPLSELIVNAAMEHLSEEVLLKSPKETYEQLLWEEERKDQIASNSEKVTSLGLLGGGKQIIQEWQKERKEQEGTGESYLTNGGLNISPKSV